MLCTARRLLHPPSIAGQAAVSGIEAVVPGRLRPDVNRAGRSLDSLLVLLGGADCAGQTLNLRLTASGFRRYASGPVVELGLVLTDLTVKRCDRIRFVGSGGAGRYAGGVADPNYHESSLPAEGRFSGTGDRSCELFHAPRATGPMAGLVADAHKDGIPPSGSRLQAADGGREMAVRRAGERMRRRNEVDREGRGCCGPPIRSNMSAPLHAQELPANQGLNVLALCGTRSDPELRRRGHRTCRCRDAPSLQKLPRE